MRLLTIGYALPNIETDNHNLFNAPSWFDYEAVFVDPLAFTAHAAKLLEGEQYETHDGRPVVNGAGTAELASAAEHIRRRADEAARLLDSGGVIVVLARPNATQAGILGFEGLDRYFWLPAPAGVHWGPPVLRGAEGKNVRVVAEDSPFAGVLRDFRSSLTYRAVFDGNHRAIQEHGRVIACGGSNAPIAVQFKVLAGTVLFLPVIRDDLASERSTLAQRVIDAIRQLLRQAEPVELPYWARSVEVPGLAAEEQALAEATSALDAAQQQVVEKRRAVESLNVRRRLITDDGKALVDAAAEAFELLGFAVTRDEEGRLSIAGEDKTLLVECEGSRDEVVEWPYVRLQRRLETRLLQNGELLGGLIVANGFRGQDLTQRSRQFTEALKVASENYRYGLVTGETLLELVRRVMAGASDAGATGIRRRIVGAVGYLDTPHATGDAAPETPAEPLF